MSTQNTFQNLILKWQNEINDNWDLYKKKNCLHWMFSTEKSIYLLLDKIIWVEAGFEYMQDYELAKLTFYLPCRKENFTIVFENHAYDFSVYLIDKDKVVSLNELFDSKDAGPTIWKVCWEFDIFSYAAEYQRIIENIT